MPMYINGAMVGMYDAVRDEDYQKKLDVKIGEILGDKESISLNSLKTNSVFAKAYNELDAAGKARIGQIANMEGDAKNVSERELKVILTAMDANLQEYEWIKEKAQKFFMDGNPSTGETGGLNQATDKELQDILQNTKTRAEKNAATMKQEQEDRQILTYIKKKCKNFKVFNKDGKVNAQDVTKALEIINQSIPNDSDHNYDLHERAIKDLFGDSLFSDDTYRDGGSKEYRLNDGTIIYQDFSFTSREYGAVTVTYPDQTKEKVLREKKE